MSNAKPVSSVTWPARIVSFALEGLKLFGIALTCFLVIGGVTIVAVRNGIVIPATWFGLCFWTGFFVWIICRTYRANVRHTRFWAPFSILLPIHLAAFIVVLRTYPDWRMAWFPLVAIVEVPCIAMALDEVLPRKHPSH